MAIPDVLADELRRAAERQREARVERDRLIVEAYRAGGTLREIAAVVDLSNPAVLYIIRRDSHVEADP